MGFNLVTRYLGSEATVVKKNLSVYFAVGKVINLPWERIRRFI